MEWLWLAAAVPALLFGLLVCPVRYRLEASRESGFFSVSVLCGVYTKTFRWDKKKKTAEIARGEEERVPSPGQEPKEENTPPERKTENMKKAAGISEKKENRGGTDKKEKENKETGNGKPAKEAESGKRMSKAGVLLLAWRNGTIRLTLRTLGRLIRHTSPGFFLIEGRAGLSDPADTGMAAGLVYAYLPRHNRIEWIFTEKCMDLSAKAAGRIIPLYLLYLAAGLAIARPVRETLRAYRGNA